MNTELENGGPASPLTVMFRWIRRKLGMHEWEYRNPYDRTCEVCGRHEVQYCWSWDWGGGWWESHDDGDTSKHQREKK